MAGRPTVEVMAEESDEELIRTVLSATRYIRKVLPPEAGVGGKPTASNVRGLAVQELRRRGNPYSVEDAEKAIWEERLGTDEAWAGRLPAWVTAIPEMEEL